MNFKEKIKIKRGETFEGLEMAALPDEALEGIAGGADGTLKCTCDECGAVLDGEDAAMDHYLVTGHCSYHYTA